MSVICWITSIAFIFKNQEGPQLETATEFAHAHRLRLINPSCFNL